MKVSSLDVAEKSTESDADEVDPFLPHDEEAGSLLKERESSHFKKIDSKESSNFLRGKEMKKGLGHVLRLKHQK